MGRNVQITQYIALKFEVVDTVFDDVSDADDTGKLAVPKYHQMTRAMMRHQSHCTFQIVLRRNGDKVTCHNFLHCHRSKTIAIPRECVRDVSLGKNPDDLT